MSSSCGSVDSRGACTVIEGPASQLRNDLLPYRRVVVATSTSQLHLHGVRASVTGACHSRAPLASRHFPETVLLAWFAGVRVRAESSCAAVDRPSIMMSLGRTACGRRALAGGATLCQNMDRRKQRLEQHRVLVGDARRSKGSRNAFMRWYRADDRGSLVPSLAPQWRATCLATHRCARQQRGRLTAPAAA